MKIFRLSNEIIVEHKGQMFQIKTTNWDAFINRPNLYKTVSKEIAKRMPSAVPLSVKDAIKPIMGQEVWASGVTYMRSKTARMEESKKAGGATFYDKVYDAERPELFFKSTAARCVGPNEKVRIRKDSAWNVPEPELCLFICSTGSIEGYTIGNDMSSRSIEGENPLYLPQAKTYSGSAALGPCIFVPEDRISLDTRISMVIKREHKTILKDSVGIDQIKRKLEDLVAYLFRECDFDQGVFLMTGTGIVPSDDFTLLPNDEVAITIDSIGTLVNIVA